MVEDRIQDEIPDYGINTLQRTHDLMLEALRHREQEMIRYLAILVPALGGYGWLVQNAKEDIHLFTIGTLSVLLLLTLGAIYSLALGYNFRYVILQLAKLEVKLQITNAILEGWPRSKKDFLDRYKLWGFPWCTPPELIKVFWIAFLIGILGVMISAGILLKCEETSQNLLTDGGTLCFLIGLLAPYYYGRKLRKVVCREPEYWAPLKKIRSDTVDEGENKDD